MSDPNLENAVVFLFSSLFSTLEELAKKSMACEILLNERDPDWRLSLPEANILVRQSDEAFLNTQLRLEAIQAARERDFDKVIEIARSIASKHGR